MELEERKFGKSPKIIYILEWDETKEDVFVWKLVTFGIQKEIIKTLDVKSCGKNVYMCFHDNLGELIEANQDGIQEV